ncbi:MAG TPA: glycosyltransferase family 2 protein [Anaerolineae bacterium]|nr:glycosyltransferase family 2 protein [Anaerolineae bacterium]
MDAEQVSVVIPSWNGARLLPACLDSLREQTWSRSEVIVVDNASTDETVTLVQREYSEVRVIALARNRGFSSAVNVGICAAEGEFVAVLNQDVEVDPQWLEELAVTALAHPEAGAVASKIMLWARRDHLHSAGDLYRLDGIPVNRGVWEKDQGQYDAETEVFGACGGAALYRIRALDEIGTFDESFFMYCEDVDLAWRQQLAGWRAVYAPRAIAFHHLSASGGGVTASYYSGRNTILVIAKNMPCPLLLKYWRAILAAQLRIGKEAVCAWRGAAARARLRGQMAGLLTWPRVLNQRRAVQRSCRVSLEYLEGLLQPID